MIIVLKDELGGWIVFVREGFGWRLGFDWLARGLGFFLFMMLVMIRFLPSDLLLDLFIIIDPFSCVLTRLDYFLVPSFSYFYCLASLASFSAIAIFNIIV